jgi:class 3 adenylate cyclase/tetratricopeptide (TPR) repeat protein
VAVCPSCGKELPPGEFPFCPFCATPLRETAPAAREQRKTVTVLFCDVTGSTALGESTDPEALRALLARYFERMKQIVESHGGTVEKFIGDAVMAVFGVPQVHEDDALRAVRAATEMRDALPELGVQARIGVNTGEVVTGTEERLATGDAVNVAARLEQAASPGEILIGDETLRLVRDAVEAEAIEPLELKGKAEPVPAFRMLEVTGELQRRHIAPLVGRERELQALRDAFSRVIGDRSCQLFTVLGTAGVGKSRLAAEFLAATEAQVVRARCLSYGEGITYWPVVEVLTQLGVRPEEESAATSIAALLGESEAATTPDEIAWAARKTFERAAVEEPLVVVFDDIHWGEPAFLDLVEHVADFSRDAPILLLCIARPELLERREGWGGGKVNATTVLLEPLSAEETDELINKLGYLAEGLRERIREAAEGNPLFVEEMLAMVAAAGNGDVAVPPTIQALLAARIDQLDASERAVLERGAVEGKVFHRGAVQALAPEEPEVLKRLMSLVRKELVRPDKPVLAGDDAFRFRHLLIRDAAYDALPKAERADLHERFARWLEEHGVVLVELDEILGYHLEQATLYRKELGQEPDERVVIQARNRLVAAGRRAILRSDYRAARTLLERASALVPHGRIEPFEFELVDVDFHLSMDDSQRRAQELAERAVAIGDETAQLTAKVMETQIRAWTDPEGASEKLQELATELVRQGEEDGDDLALYVGYFGLVVFCHMRCLFDTEIDYLDSCVAAARRLGLRHLENTTVRFGGSSRTHGNRIPLPAALDWIEEQEAAGIRDPGLALNRAAALGLAGRFDEAREVVGDVTAEFVDRGALVPLALLKGLMVPEIEDWAGNPAAGVEAGEEGCMLLEEVGDKGWLSTASAQLAECYIGIGDLDRAYELTVRSKELGASDDMANEERWREARAKVLARRGDLDEAERLAREALAVAERMEHPNAWAFMTLGDVMEHAGRTDEAAQWYERAQEAFEKKGMVALVEQVRRRLDPLLQLDQ